MRLMKGRTSHGKPGKEGERECGRGRAGRRGVAMVQLGESITVLSNLRSLNFISLLVEGGSGLEVSTSVQGSLPGQHQRRMRLLDQAEHTPLKPHLIWVGWGKMQMEQSNRRARVEVNGAEAQPARGCGEGVPPGGGRQDGQCSEAEDLRTAVLCDEPGDAGELPGVCETRAEETAVLATHACQETTQIQELQVGQEVRADQEQRTKDLEQKPRLLLF